MLTVGQHLLFPARLAGSFAGVLDTSLQSFYLTSEAGIAHGLRLFGLAVLAIAAVDRRAVTLLAVLFIAGSFTLVGHTATHSPRWLLAPLLLTHLFLMSFWFGSLRPMRRQAVKSTGSDLVQTLSEFSRVGVFAVPLLAAAGLTLAVALIGSFERLYTAYGAMVLAKCLGVVVLAGLASINRWRLTPRIRRGDAVAVRMFRRFALAEWLLIAVVVAATVIVTTFVSPQGLTLG